MAGVLARDRSNAARVVRGNRGRCGPPSSIGLLLGCLLGAWVASHSALAQSGDVEQAGDGPEAREEVSADAANGDAAPGEEPVHAIVGGTVLRVSGPPIHRGTILFRGTKILEVGSEIPIPEGAVRHAADGLHVSPGLVAVEAAVSNARYSSGNYADNLDPYHRDLHLALASGITTMQVVSSGASFFFGDEGAVARGQPAAIIKSTREDLDNMLVKEPSAIYYSFRQSMASVYEERSRFRQASEYRRQLREAKEKNEKPPKLPRELKPYVDILENELPVICYADDLETIRVVLELRETYPFRLVISGGRDGWKIARELIALDVPVMVKARGPDFNFDMESSLFEEGDMIPIRRPAAYAEGGVRVAILPYKRGPSLSGLAGRDLLAYPFEAAFAVRGGMSQRTALRAITLEPAKILGIDNRVGSLEKGKDADILIWSGHPLHYRSFVLTAWINGKVYYEREKSRLYRDVPLPR